MKNLTLIHHTARRDDHNFPPNSLPALEHCLHQGARIIEVDISMLDGDDFLIAHDNELDHFSTGTGSVSDLTVSDAGALRLVWRGEVTDLPPMLLSQALDLVAQQTEAVELQLDLKEHRFLDDDALELLVRMVRPVRDKVRITSGADWAVRRLRSMDAALPLGFDPLLYLAWDGGSRPSSDSPPFRRGAFAYWDDHPLALWRWGPTQHYLRERADALSTQAPEGSVWYISARLLAASLDDGFDWISFLHERGVEVDAWTLDPSRTGVVKLAQRILDAGVDRITTNEPLALAAALSGDVSL